MDTDTLEFGPDDTDGQFRIEIEVPHDGIRREVPLALLQRSAQIRRGFPSHRDKQVAEELQTIGTNILEVFPEDNTRPDDLQDSPIVFSVSNHAVVSEIEQAIDMRATQINYEDRPADGWDDDLGTDLTIIEQD